MKKYVFTIKDDVCAANDKPVEATELISKMRLWGDVEDYDGAIAAVKAEYQATVNNLTAQLQAIKEQELTDDELRLVLSYRACKAAISEKYQNRIDTLEGQLEDIKVEEKNRLDQIMAILGQRD